jgi:hypothetical protein
MQSKLIVTAVGTFGIGALVGWAVTADILENRFKRERADYDQLLGNKTQHIWALQDRLESRSVGEITVSVDPNQQELVWAREKPVMSIEIDEDKIHVYSPAETVEQEESEVPEGETPEETRTNLQKLIDQYTADQDAQERFGNLAYGVEGENSPPFVISKAVYAWDDEGEHYEKITLTYFPRDRVLLDDDEDPIEDVAAIVGWRSLSQFGGESEDPDVVFVRNRRLQTDFEVVKEDGAQLPLHVKYGMEKEEFRVNKAAGLIRLRQEDDDN